MNARRPLRFALAAVTTTLALATSALADHNDHDEQFRRLEIELDGYSCEPCVALGYVKAFEVARDANNRVLTDLNKLEGERDILLAQLEVKRDGAVKVRRSIASTRDLLATVERQLEPSRRLETAKGFDEIELLEREKVKRKLSRAERKRLENLKKKRHDFRENHSTVNKHKRVQQYLTRIEALELQLRDIDRIPAIPVLEKLIAEKTKRIRDLRPRVEATERAFLKAKRELVFCTSHFELQRILREHDIETHLPYDL